MPEDHDRLSKSLMKSFSLASRDDLEAWRIGAGRPRMGIDAFEGDLPQEAGLMDAVDLGKGHFLGRDALTAIDASTPLRTVVLAVETAEPVSPGEQLSLGGERAGELTSVTGTDDGVRGLARVVWELRSGPWVTESGIELGVRS
jgi:glycine cleavage system aminomethyltransferase T